MAFDYFTLQALAAEIEAQIAGKKIVRVAAGSEGISFACDRTGQIRFQGGREGFLEFQAGVWPTATGGKGPEEYLLQAGIDRVWAEARDRIVRMRLIRVDRQGQATHGQLICELIPLQSRAVLVSERTGKILGCWGKGGRREGEDYHPPRSQERLLPGQDDFARFLAQVRRPGAIAEIGPKVLALMDRSTFAELLHRAGLAGEIEVARVEESALQRLWEIAAELYAQPPVKGAFAWEEAGRFFFSALEPTRLGSAVIPMASVSQALDWVVQRRQERAAAEQRQQRLAGVLKGAAKALERKIEVLRQELREAEQAADLEKKGNLLFAQLAAVKPGAASVALPDIYDRTGMARIAIELDPGRTPAANAARYLKVARKYQRRLEVIPPRLETYLALARQLEERRRALAERGATALDEIEEWLQKKGMMRTRRTDLTTAEKRDAVHPRRYRTSDGWSVWAGRNNRENDLLTHRLASQNDLWFHAHGYPGAHVLLRREGRQEEPGPQALEEAARIAAYWSKGRTARKVPVIYTQVKYVSRPRGAAPGQARVRREKTLVVEPGLLPEEDDFQSSAGIEV